MTCPRPDRHQFRGFSLLEILLVLFLTGIILFMVSRLTQQTLSSLKFLQEKTQTLQSAALGIERLSSELREAVEVSGLSPLEFKKVDPSAPFALDYDQNSSPNVNPGDPDPALDPDSWSSSYASDGFGRNQLGTVRYVLNDQLLTRRVTRGTATLTTGVAVNVNAFVVERWPTATDNNFRIALSLQEKRRVVSFVTIVVVPGIER